MNEKIQRLKVLKQEKNAVILAHYYVPDEVQEVADYVGDSYYLSEVATKVEAQTVIMCGVSFMGESAKLLNPEKKVLLPDMESDCPMAHMCDVNTIEKVRGMYEDLAVVCYVNSTVELKAHADVCVTSSNALKIVKNLPNKNIFFIPDVNLARHIALQVPDKHFIFNDGYCPIHNEISPKSLEELKKLHPEAKVLVHPECTQAVVQLADYVGSTSGIISYASESDCGEFIIGTEMGVFCQLVKNNPEKKFYPIQANQICPGMKRITLDKIIHVLETSENQVLLQEETARKANLPLKKMLEMAR